MWTVVFAAIVTIAIFFGDLTLPLGVAVGVLYVATVLIGWWMPWRRSIVILAGISSGLIFAGYFLSPEAEIPWIVFINRCISLFVVWGTAGLLLTVKKSLLETSRSQERIRTIVDTIIDGIITIDARGVISTFNPGAENIFGYASGEVIGRNVNMLMSAFYHGEHDGYLAKYRETGEAKIVGVGREVEGQRKDGSTFPMALAVGEMNIGGERIFTGIVRDITERKQAEEALVVAKEDAEAAAVAKSEFLANMSHELRTPLNAVIGYSEILEEDAIELVLTESVSDLQKIKMAGRHLLTLINDVLDLSRVEAGRMDLAPERFQLRSLLEEVLAAVRPAAEANGNNIELHPADDLGDAVNDRTKLTQVLLNLMSNAAKFTENGHIDLLAERETDPEGEWFVFRVRDTGIGIAPEHLERVFEEFSQANGTTGRQYGGTGLGLAISRRICQLMGGDIAVESKLGAGSVFSARIPAFVSETPRTVPAAPVAVPSGEMFQADEGPALILIIDDDPSSRELMSRYLTGEGYNVVTANNGAEGLILAKKLRPAAITLDVLMPEQDGWSVLSELKSDPDLVGIPVIMCTIVDEASCGFALGAAEYLIKPIDRRRLAAILRRFDCPTPPCTVLIVDDDDDSRAIMRIMFDRAGWIVVEAVNGREALERLADTTPALILLDLMMPEMDGFEVVVHIQARDDWCDIPVVIVTAKDLTDADHRLLTGNVEQIIEKTNGDADSLLREVGALLSRNIHNQGKD